MHVGFAIRSHNYPVPNWIVRIMRWGFLLGFALAALAMALIVAAFVGAFLF